MDILSNGTTKYVLNLADQTPEESDVIPQEDTTYITPLLFPAIGALLMLMFGGLLFSSGTTLCKTKTVPDNKYKKKFEQQYGRRTIRFHNVPENIAQEPTSVLQQENNDVVDAVKKEYQDLPQYQPVSGVVGNIVGLLGQTCAVNILKPDVIDKGASPIHFTRNDNTSDYDNPSYKDRESDVGLDNDEKRRDKKLSFTLHAKIYVGEDNGTQRIATASSGIGTNSPESFEIDSLEEFSMSENDSQLNYETAMLESNGSGIPVDTMRPVLVPKIDRGVYSGGRLSVLQLECAPSCLCVHGCNCSIHGTKADKIDALNDGKRKANERLTWGDIARNTNTENLAPGNQSYTDNTRSEILRFNTPSEDVSGTLTTKNMQERNQSPLRCADLEKWLNEVEESRRVSDESYAQTLLDLSDAGTEKHSKDYLFTRKKKSISSHRRRRAPLQESLQLLKRLQLVSEDDLQLVPTKSSVHRGGRESCLKTVRAPSSLCLCGGKCEAHCQVDVSSDQLFADPFGVNEESTDILSNEYQFNSTRTERIAKGGRQSSLNHVRASSKMCIHGPSCQFHCQKIENVESMTKAAQQSGKKETFERKYQELHLQEIRSELNELRGASSFGEVQDSSQYKTIHDQSNGYSTPKDNDFRKEECSDNNLRGASSFGDSNSAKTQQNTDSNKRGASSFAQEFPKQLPVYYSYINQTNDSKSNLDETRGASCFAPLDESIAGTSSVTLSIAVESDNESFLVGKSLDKKGSVSTLNLRTCADKLSGRKQVSKTVKQELQTNFLKSKDICKEKFDLDQNNNSSTDHVIERSKNHERDGRSERIELDARSEITRTKKIDEQKHASKDFDGRFLKVGKDTTMMCTLLHALRRDGDQKQKQTSVYSKIPQRIKKDNIANSDKSLAGSLKFSVFYKGADSSTPLLYVSVLGLEDVSDEIITPLHSTYVKVCLFPKFTTWRKTKTLNISEKQLVFKDHFIISGVKPADLEEAMLRFDVVCVEEEERIIGQLEVPLAELKSRDKLKRTCALQATNAKAYGTAG